MNKLFDEYFEYEYFIIKNFQIWYIEIQVYDYDYCELNNL